MITTKLLMVSMSVCAFGLILGSGCAVQQKKEEAAAKAMSLTNCKYAPGNLRVLNSEKTSTAARIGEGVAMIAPIGIVEGVLTGTEGTKYQVTTGEYNKLLDEKMAQIKAACPGVQAD